MDKEIKNLETLDESANEEGATMVEYALMVALVAIVLIAVIAFMTSGVSTAFSRVGSATTTAG